MIEQTLFAAESCHGFVKSAHISRTLSESCLIRGRALCACSPAGKSTLAAIRKSPESEWEVSHHLDRTLGQRLYEGLAVLLGQDAIVQCDNNAGIGLGADEPAHPLTEFQDRFRQ